MRWFSERTVLVLVAMFCLAIAGVLWQQQRLHQRLVRSTSLEEARRYATALETFRTLYTSEVVARLSGHNVEVTHDYDSDEKRGPAIPLPATLSMKIGNELGAKLDGGTTRLYSDFPFPYPGRDGLSDQFARDAWEAITSEPDKPFHRFENVNGSPQLRYAIADRMRASCVACHNTHPDSPKRDWREGDVRGILEVSLPLGGATEQVSANLRESFLLLTVVGGIGLLGLVVVIRRLRRTSEDLELRVQHRTVELEQTAQSLSRQETQARSLISSSPAALIMVNRKSEITLLNQQAEKLFGYRQEELVGKSIEILVPERSRDVHPQLSEQYFQSPSPRPMGKGRNLSGVQKDGTEIPVEIGLTPIETDDGLAVLAAILDLREQKRTEEKLTQQADKLREAKEIAEVANRAKSEFLANMSHEIRTPMNAIIGMTELVLESDLNDTQRDYLQIVDESAESLLSIINEILDFSKIESGRLELQTIDFELQEQVGDTLKSLGQRAYAKNLELAWHVHPDVPIWLSGDPTRLRQMLVNLVGNAIKFTDQGEVLVEMQCESRRNSEVTLHVSVRDTGSGIPEEKQATIFSAFEQVDSSTTRRFGGTGLGLAITARIAEAMGGRVWVDSTLGVGSTFHFTAVFQEAMERHTDTKQLPDLNGVVVVIVDDNKTNLHILQEILQSWGMSVHAVADGSQAISELTQTLERNQKLPLLISDVNMPEMDGFELVERLRSLESLRDTVVILLTSGGRSGDQSRCELLKVSGHLMKPVKQSELLETILIAVGKQPATESVKQPARPADDVLLPSLKILLAEDSKANQILAVGLLTKWGHHVEVAINGEEAIMQWQAGCFDIILMDVQMPVLDGLEATRRLRELEEPGQHIPIIAMTARAMKGDRESCMAAGMDDYVSKPIRRTELSRALHSFGADKKH